MLFRSGIDVDPATLQGICEPMCDTGPDGSGLCSEPGELCVLTGPAGVPLCYLECDPAAPEPPCPRGEICMELNPEVAICT